MNTYHFNASRYAHHLLLASSLTLLGACLPPFSTAVERFDDGYKSRVATRIRLEEQHAALRQGYDKDLEEANTTIKLSKQKIEASLESGDLYAAFNEMGILNNKVHADEGKRGTRMTRVVQHAGLEQREYLRDAARRGLGRADTLLAAGEFQIVDRGLERAVLLGEVDDRTKKAFKARQGTLYVAWLEYLKQAAANTRKTHPGSALVYALQGKSIAAKVQNAQAEQELGALVKELSSSLAKLKGYYYSFDAVSGSFSDNVVKAVARVEWGSQIYYTSSETARTDGMVTMMLGSPSHRSSQGKSEGSFKYVSGTRMVNNPAYHSAESSLSYAKSMLTERENEASRTSSDSSGYDAAQRGASEARQRVASAQSKLASTPKEIEENVFSTYTYPITVHTLNSSMKFTASHTSTRGLPTINKSETLRSTLTDEEHAAHTQGNGSVSADPASPPSNASGDNKLEQLATSTLKVVILDGFKTYQASQLQGYDALTTREDRANHLAIYVFLGPGTADKDRVRELEALAKVSDLVMLFQKARR